VPAGAQVNVTQHHNHDSRDGLYVDPAFTQTNAASLTHDLGFDGTISGSVYAQPLYIDNGPGGVPTVIAATESNIVYALDATDGTIIWQQQNLGTPVALANLPCGNINPMGITGTHVIDLASRSIFLDAMTTPDERHDQETPHLFSQSGHRSNQSRLACRCECRDTRIYVDCAGRTRRA
jgi:hypothetical protein